MFHEELKHSAKTAFGKAKRHGKTNRSKHTMFYPRRYANDSHSRK